MSGPYKLTGRETSYMPQLTIVILQYRPDAAALRRTIFLDATVDSRSSEMKGICVEDKIRHDTEFFRRDALASLKE